LITCHYQPT